MFTSPPTSPSISPNAAKIVELVELEADGVTGLVLADEDQVEDAYGSVRHELLDLGGDIPVELVARGRPPRCSSQVPTALCSP